MSIDIVPRKEESIGYVITILLFCVISVVQSIPPEPVACNSNSASGCIVSSTYSIWADRIPCKAAAVAYPTTEEEIVSVVASAVQNNQKMKVVTRGCHSIPKLVCPGGDNGLLISTRDYRKNIIVNKDNMIVTADSGVSIRELIDTVANAGLALPHSPYWEGVTLGGVLGTGAHGSSLYGKGSALHEYVVAMTIVVPASSQEGYAKVIYLTDADEELNAAKVSLGVLGVISQVTIKLQPQFKRSLTNSAKGDRDFEQLLLQFGMAHEFGDFTWYPAQKKVIYKADDRVPVDTSGNGFDNYIGFRPTSSALLATSRTIEETLEATRDSMGKCIIGQTQTFSIITSGAGYMNSNLGFTHYPVVGFQHLMQTSGSCLYANSGLSSVCPWDPRVKGLFFHQTTVGIPLSSIASFILDVKRLRDVAPTGLCGVDLYDGFLMRFVKGSSAYLGAQEDAIEVDITYYRARHAKTPRLHEDKLEEVEQMALVKYGGRPHWGKNRNLAFDGVTAKYPQIAQFLEVKKRLDPEGLFSSEWSDAVLGIGNKTLVSSDEDYCALEGLCVCSEDRHCAPEEGYVCRPGLVYTAARVCRYVKP